MPQAFGGTYPARIWREIMSKALSGAPVTNFAGGYWAPTDSGSSANPTPGSSDTGNGSANGSQPGGTVSTPGNAQSPTGVRETKPGAAQDQAPAQANPAIPGAIKPQPDGNSNPSPRRERGARKSLDDSTQVDAASQ
jgi:membrane peptidoglycan carboxypeptidase